MKDITVGMLIYLVICAALVFAVGLYQDLKRYREFHHRDAGDSRRAPDTTLRLEMRDIEPPRNAPRTRHAA